jgi:hypothetical protein
MTVSLILGESHLLGYNAMISLKVNRSFGQAEQEGSSSKPAATHAVCFMPVSYSVRFPTLDMGMLLRYVRRLSADCMALYPTRWNSL